MAKYNKHMFQDPYGEDQFDKNHKFKIPDRFIKALNALHPEIEKLVICDVNRVGVYDAITFNPIYRFELTVNVHIKDESLINGGGLYYTDILNSVFKITYVDMEFVSFKSSLIVTPRLTNLQLFYKVFGDEQKEEHNI
jgi:hypothetical protein